MVCSWALVSDNFVVVSTSKKNCTSFSTVVGECLICLLIKNRGNTKKATEISLDEFQQYLKERKLDEEQPV